MTMKTLGLLIITLAMLIALTGITLGATLCPWGEIETVPSGQSFNLVLSNAGVCDGYIVADEEYQYNARGNISGSVAYTDFTMGLGAYEFAKETTINSPTPTITTQKGITFVGQSMMQDETIFSLFNGLDNETPLFCEGLYDESSSDITQGQTASMLNLNNGGSNIVLDYTSAVTGDTGASGSAYAHTSAFQILANSTHQYQSTVQYDGRFTMAHSFHYGS